ncbi:MAG: ATP-binding protein [Lachnospiraceae bacterium]|jgi:DNA replication protein DnaC|nr:ATP-binding protein [Lachnospiraceae bacterium]
MYECEKCKDNGFIPIVENGELVAVECECRKKRTARLRLKNSGIPAGMLGIGFKEFDCRKDAALKNAWDTAVMYYKCFRDIEGSRHNSLILCGQSGAGKTHLGMAVCNNLLNNCQVSVVYMAYRNAVTRIKQVITYKEDYYREIGPYCTAQLLYIDDLLKGRTTDTDLNILYEIINYRYMNHGPMVISTEKMPEQLVEFDEAIGGRILEMCRPYIIRLEGRKFNYRMYSGKGVSDEEGSMEADGSS